MDTVYKNHSMSKYLGRRLRCGRPRWYFANGVGRSERVLKLDRSFIDLLIEVAFKSRRSYERMLSLIGDGGGTVSPIFDRGDIISGRLHASVGRGIENQAAVRRNLEHHRPRKMIAHSSIEHRTSKRTWNGMAK